MVYGRIALQRRDLDSQEVDFPGNWDSGGTIVANFKGVTESTSLRAGALYLRSPDQQQGWGPAHVL
jgi:hypothetical protein